MPVIPTVPGLPNLKTGLIWAMGLALVASLAGHGWQAMQLARAGEALARKTAEFATYRETQERQTREGLQALALKQAKSDKLRQEAQDAEYLARQRAEAAAVALGRTAGQLQRYATDLTTSLSDRADAAQTAESRAAAAATAGVCPQLLGKLDARAESLAVYADKARLAGNLCVATYEALTP